MMGLKTLAYLGGTTLLAINTLLGVCTADALNQYRATKGNPVAREMAQKIVGMDGLTAYTLCIGPKLAADTYLRTEEMK